MSRRGSKAWEQDGLAALRTWQEDSNAWLAQAWPGTHVCGGWLECYAPWRYTVCFVYPGGYLHFDGASLSELTAGLFDLVYKRELFNVEQN